MKRTGIIAAMIIWCVCAVKLISFKFSQSSDIITAFESMDYSAVDTIIDAYGYYGSGEMSGDNAKNLVTGIMGCLGINGSDCRYIVSENCVELLKESENGTAGVKLIDDSGKYYVAVNILIKNRTDCALTYKSMVEDLFDAAGIDGGYVNLNLRGEVCGALNYYERNRIADRFLEMLDAYVVVENRDNSLFTIYAYTDRIDSYVLSSGRRVNVNIVETYDEVRNCTVIYLATPINNLDY